MYIPPTSSSPTFFHTQIWTPCKTKRISPSMELENSTEIMASKSSTRISSTPSSLYSDPLFSTVITLYTLLLLYTPNYTLFLKIILSPVFTATGILLLFLLRLGAIERNKQNQSLTPGQGIQKPEGQLIGEDEEHKRVCLKAVGNHCTEPEEQKQRRNDGDGDDPKWVCLETDSGEETGLKYGSGLNSFCLDWNLRSGAPLEIIYEEYEGEEEEEERNDGVSGEEEKVRRIERYPSLSMYYPESDSDSSSDGDFPMIGDWDSPERMLSKWEEEEEGEREEMIEFAFGKDFRVEEDNLIEIDISPMTRRSNVDNFPARVVL